MKGLGVALLVSLAINIALISFMAGRLAGGAPPRLGAHAAQERFIDRAPPEVRDLLRGKFAERWRDVEPAQREVRRLRTALRDAILAEPFDRKRVEAAYAAFRAADAAIQQIHGSVVIDALAELPLEDRKMLVDALAAPGRGRPPRPQRPHDARDLDAPPDAPRAPPPQTPGNRDN